MMMFINKLNQTKYLVSYIHRLMKLLNIKSIIRRQKYNYVKSKPKQIGKNILAINFKTEFVNQKWCYDVAKFKNT